MQLVYFWIEEYKVLDNFEINLSSKYRLEFDKDKIRLTIVDTQENNDLLKTIAKDYRCINDLIAIVGENGTGKTTILKWMHHLKHADGISSIMDDRKPYNYIAVYLSNGELYTVTNFDSLTYESILEIQTILPKDNLKRGNLMSEYKTIFYSNVFDNTHSTPYYSSNDISTNTRLIESLQEGADSYLTRTVIDWVNFKQSTYKVRTPFANRIKITVQVQNPIYPRGAYNQEEINRIQLTLDKYAPEIIKENVKRTQIKGYLFSCVKSFVFRFSHFLDGYDKYFQKNNAEFKKNYEEEVVKYFKEIEKTNSVEEDNAIKSMLQVYSFLKKQENYYDNGELPERKAIELCQLLDKCDQYVKNLINIVPSNLSSGEIAKLNLYSRFYSIKEKYSKDFLENELTIIIDECDVYMHPEWQRSFIKDFFKMCEILFGDKRINIVLTTHSPIILSDIPQNNIRLLSKEDGMIKAKQIDIDTFGANIYNLYKSGFFIKEKDNFYMGDIATDCINYVHKNINELKKKTKNPTALESTSTNSIIYEQCTQIVAIIGEEVVKNCFKLELNDIKTHLFGEDSCDLKEIKKLYKKLELKDKENLIHYIIDSND